MNQRPETAFVVGAPLVLAVLELFHPQPHDLFRLDLRAWMAVHYAQIVLFPLTALALATLVRHRPGFAAALCRAGAFVFGVTWIAFDSVAGVAVGILLRNAEASAAPDTWRAPVMSIWAHPIMGGAPDTVPLLAVAGSLAWAVGCLAAAVALRRAGISWGPIVLLALSAVSFGVFKTHAWPGGPIAFGAQAAAVAWARWSAV
ncbi:MAG TPA: hypothetical protein VJZ73_15665 [Methylomirabilota bacterium]|nr:hypothetical protein [Methylomirabilota bacterium]